MVSNLWKVAQRRNDAVNQQARRDLMTRQLARSTPSDVDVIIDQMRQRRQ